MDITLLFSLIAFFCMAASWLMLPTSGTAAEPTPAAAPQPQLSEA